MTNYVGNGAFQLNRLTLTVPGSEEQIDLRSIYIDLVLFESIWEDCMSGSISLIDSYNMKDTLPLSGNEKIEIDFNTLGNEERKIAYTGYVYKITPDNQITEHSSGFVIHFTSKAFLDSARTFVQRGFSDTCTGVVKQIYDTTFKEGLKPFFIEKSKGIKEFTFGNMKPLEGISVALREAVSESGNSGYLFYEDNVAFNCITLESLYGKPSKFSFDYSPINAFEDVTQRGNENFNKIQKCEILEESAFLDKVMDGGMGSTNFFFDLFTKTFEEIKYDEIGNFDLNKSIGTKPVKREEVNPKYSDNLFLELRSNANTNGFFVRSKFTKQEIHKIRARIMVYGDTSVRAGDCCDAKLPNYNSTQGSNLDTLSGKFLITEVKHSFSNSQYHMTLMIQKNAYEM